MIGILNLLIYFRIIRTCVIKISVNGYFYLTSEIVSLQFSNINLTQNLLLNLFHGDAAMWFFERKDQWFIFSSFNE